VLRFLYQLLLERDVKKKGNFPKHIMIICSELGEGFQKFLNWCKKFGIQEITICSRNIKKINYDIDGIKINFVDKSGREEIIDAIRKIAEKAMRGEIKAEEVSEDIFESLLILRSQPDMIVKAGKEVPEFMIWQSIYSELLFMDVDWKTIRYIDFLRMMREYQRRERRYGR